MPAAPRPKGKATKIAYRVLGKPQNEDQKKSREQSDIDKRLVFEETQRVR